MKKIVFIGICFLLISCNKKEVLLPQIPETVVADIKDHSPIYMFFETNGNDTLIQVNRKNSIVSTNWLFNIDKRLPLKLVIPEIQNLQAKKENSEHKNKAAENFYTYMDSNKKTLAFIPFTNVVFILKEPNSFKNSVYFLKSGKVKYNEQVLEISELERYLNDIKVEKETEIVIGFDKNISFQDYIRNRFKVKKMKINNLGLSVNFKNEYIY